MGLLDRFKKTRLGNWTPPKLPRIGSTGAPSTPPWITDEVWRDWGPPLDIVTGESHYDANLRKVAGPPRPGGWLVACEAELRREPDNRYDPDAIAVHIEGRKVGHITADACSDLADALDDYGANARATGIPALVRGGWPKRPNLGVMLWLHHEEIRESLPGVEWDEFIEDYQYTSWPPHDGEGSDAAAGIPSRTGARRQRSQTRAPGGEPRMPPLVDHYTDYVEDVKELKRRKDHESAGTLLLSLIDAAETESRAQGMGVPPWYYEQLAIVRRKQSDLDGEIAILERYAAMLHAPGVARAKLLARLQDARARRAKRPD